MSSATKLDRCHRSSFSFHFRLHVFARVLRAAATMFGMRASVDSARGRSSSSASVRDTPGRPIDATSAAGPSSSRTSFSSNPIQNTTYNPAAAFSVAVSEWTDADNALAALASLQSDVDRLKRRLAEEQTTYQALKDHKCVATFFRHTHDI